MGNSGSQNPITESPLPEEQWVNSFPRTYHSQTKLHFQHKVLPEKTPQLKLRSTNNGEILQSGGTISGRHVKSTEQESSRRYVQGFEEGNSIEQKRYEKDYQRTAIQGVQHKLSNHASSQQMKSFASEPDLRLPSNDELREKRSKKKYKAPPPPKKKNLDNSNIILESKENMNLNPSLPIRKARLFKTRTETKKQSSQLNENVHDDSFTTEYNRERSTSKIPNPKRLSLPECKFIDSSAFTRELKDATQRFRYLEKTTSSPTEIRMKKSDEDIKKTIDNQAKNVMTTAREEASGKESTTPEMSPTFMPKYSKEKNPLGPKQLIYFGMNETSRDVTFKENVFKNFNRHRDVDNSSASDISSDIDSDENDTFKSGIDLKLRPILPKKQLEIPRFSPAAAWRLLSLDTNDNYKTMSITSQTPTTDLGSGACAGGFVGTIITDDVPLLMEEHIEKYYRPLPPPAGQRSCNDKSGDSGISGDDPVPIVYCYDGEIVDNDDEVKMRMHQNKTSVRCTRKDDRERISWTPQQDLDDSSAEEELELRNKSAQQIMRTHGGPHVFSLSLPRENHLASYMVEKNSAHFNGLQKFKKSMTGVWGNLSNKKDFPNVLEEPSNNWFLSKSAPNSLTNTIHSLERHKTRLENQPHSPSNINAPTRFMYLPEIDFNPKYIANKLFSYKCASESKSCEDIELELKKTLPESLQDSKPISDEPSFWKIKRKPKKYTFQSTIRQIEKKRLSDKLSREAEKRERERIRELDAMQKVEEEFQRKRASEKANIRQQMRLFSMVENSGCRSLPNFEIYHRDRSEPDGALSSSSVSSSSSSSFSTKKSFLKKVTHLKSSTLDYKSMASYTKELSEFRQSQRDYKDYNSNLLKHAIEKQYQNRQTTIHPQVSCTMPQLKGVTEKENHNYRKKFASGRRSVSTGSVRSDGSQNYTKSRSRNERTVKDNHFIPI